MSAIKLKKTEDLDSWRAGEEKSDLIDGVIYLQASPHHYHAGVQFTLGGALNQYSPQTRDSKGGWGGGGWVFKTEVGVVYGKDACTHDLAGWRQERFFSVTHSQNEIQLHPDWVCEISSSNWVNDYIRKRGLLQKAGVPHYWIISPAEKLLIALKLDEKTSLYQEHVYEGEWRDIPPFPGLSLSDLFSHIP